MGNASNEASDEERIARARADLERQRRGEDAIEALLEHLKGLAEAPWSDARNAMQREVQMTLLASASAGAVRRIIASEAELGAPLDGGLHGLLLRPGDPLGIPFEENPWGIPSDSTLSDAIARVWKPLEHRAPRFVNELKRRALGLALLRRAGSGQPMLGYVLYQELDRYSVAEELVDSERPPFDRRAAEAWLSFGDLSLLVGFGPAREPKTKGDIPLPASLRELYAVHAGLGRPLWSLWPPDELLRWSKMLDHEPPRLVHVEGARESVLSSDLVGFFSYGDDRSDLFHLREGPAEPLVRGWREGTLYAGEGQPFWEWFEDLPALFLGFEDDD